MKQGEKKIVSRMAGRGWSPQGLGWSGWQPWIVLLAGLAMTVVTCIYASRSNKLRNRLEFEAVLSEMHENIQTHIKTHVALLEGASALFGSSENVTREEFHKYVDQWRLAENYPGVQTAGFILRIKQEEKDRVVGRLRSEGVPDFRVWPEGQRGEYHSVLYVEPPNRQNHATYGLDMFTEPLLRAAMERARDQAQPAATARLTIHQVQASPRQPGFLIFVPVYTGGIAPRTVEERRARLQGFAYFSFRLNDLIENIVGQERLPLMGLEVYEGTEARPEKLLHRTGGAGSGGPPPRFVKAEQLEVADRPWLLVYSSRPALEAMQQKSLVPGWLVIGGVMSLALFFVTLAEGQARRHAEGTAARLKQTEEALRESAAQFRTLFEMAAVGEAQVEPATGRFSRVNKKFCEITGYSPEELLGMPFLNTTHPEDRNVVSADFQRALQGELPDIFTERRYLRKDGQTIWVQVNAVVVRDAVGKPLSVIGAVQDVTQRREAEHALRESEARKSAILDSALACIITMDAEGRIVDFNTAAEDTFGYHRQEVAGRTVAELLVPHRLREAHSRGLRRFLETGEGPVLGRRLEMTALCADGREIPIELAITVTRLDGRPPFFTAYLRDITQRKRAEQSTQRLAAIVESSQDAIISKNLEGIITSWNRGAERIFGYTADEALGQPLAFIVPPENLYEEAEILDKIQRGQSLEHFETVRLRKDGQRVNISLAVSPLKDMDGKVVGSSKIARDITERKRSEEALRREKEFAETLMNSVPGVFYLFDHEGRYLQWNKTLEEVTGYSAAEISRMHPLDLFAEQDRPHIIERIQKVFESGRATAEAPLVTKDGRSIPYFYTGLRINLESGQALVGVGMDITERKQAEQALRQSERRLNQAIHVAGLGIFDHDHRADTLYWSPKAREIFGWGPEEPVSVSAFLQCVHPDDREKVAAAIRRSHDPAGDGSFDVDYRLLRTEGPIRCVSAHAQTFFEGEGTARRPVYSVGAALDITERKRAEQALRESEARFRIMAETIPDFLFTTRPDGWCDYTNLRFQDYTGLSLQASLGEGWMHSLHPDDVERSRETWLHSVQTGHPYEIEYRYRSKEGGYRWFVARAHPVRDDQGRLMKWFGAITDIHDLVTAHEEIQNLNCDLEQRVDQRTAQLNAANQELEAFSYSVAHDLRAPLRAMRGFMTILKRGYSSNLPAEGLDLLNRGLGSADRMNQLIEDLLNLSRLGRQELRCQPVSLNSLLELVRTELSEETEQRHIEWLISPLSDVDGDPGLLKQVLTNLLGNAVKYTRPREWGVIEVGQMEQEGETVFFVRDNGVGFRMDHARRLFAPFQRLHSEQQFEGTGVGLANVERIIHKHGGRVWAEAEQDKGATFYFTLGAGRAQIHHTPF